MVVTCDLKDLKIFFLFDKAQRPQNRCKLLAVKCKKSTTLSVHFLVNFSYFPDRKDPCQYSYAVSTFHKISTNFSRKLARLQFFKKRKKNEKMT